MGRRRKVGIDLWASGDETGRAFNHDETHLHTAFGRLDKDGSEPTAGGREEEKVDGAPRKPADKNRIRKICT